jgi:putative FmdB family regulatory protein
MPIYEYECENCGHQLESIQKISDPPLTTCPECGQLSLKKLVSAAAFRLKGGGWYETDFKSGNKRNVSESGDGKAAASDSAKESKQTKEATPKKAAAREAVAATDK